MALKRSNETEEIVRFKSFEEAKEVFVDESKNVDDRIEALDYIINHKEIWFILKMLSELFKTNEMKYHPLIDYAFANFDVKPKRKEDFEEMFKLLKSDNAYLRNAIIEFLKQYGNEAKAFLEELMNSEDRDIRIFAINILGDIRFEDSLDMLRRFILKEKDINALVTAIDYLGEIGDESDIQLLKALKNEINDSYVHFAIDLAIKRIGK